MKGKNLTKKAAAIVIAAVMAFGTVACSKGGDSERKNAESIRQENQSSETSSSKENSGNKRTEYPLTVVTKGADGKEYTTVYEKAPEKVLAVYQGSIETMLALGLEDRLVATAGLDNEVPDNQKSAFSKVEYLNEFTPSKETVTMLEPDMIFSWSSLFGETTLGDAQNWIDNGTNVYINTNTAVSDDSLENEFEDILTIGKIFDVQDRAEKLVADMKNTIENVKKETSSEKATTAMVVEYMDGKFTNYGNKSIAGDMVNQLGGKLLNGDSDSVGKEDIVSANPDVIFVVYMPYAGDDANEVKNKNLEYITKDKAFSSLNAVKNKRVVPIMLSEMYASATRTQNGIETIAKGLYPDIDLK